MPDNDYNGFRLFEWAMTVALIWLGVHLLMWPRAVEASAFRAILEVVSIEVLTAIYLFIGTFRIVALYANGRSLVWGPAVRAVGALFGAGVWLQMDYALLRLHMDFGSPPSPGLPLYSVLVGAELLSTYRAAADVRKSPPHR